MTARNATSKMIIYSDDGWNKYPTADLFNYFKSKGKNVEVKDKKDFPIITKHEKYTMLQQLKRVIPLEREDGFILFDFDDKPYFNRVSSLMQHPKCLKILKAQFQKGISDKDPRVSPYTYWVKNPTIYREMREKLLKERQSLGCAIERRLFYAGSTAYGRGAFLKEIKDVLNQKNGAYSQEAYLTALSRHLVALSLPGSGSFCHRELECFGLSVPVLMPRLTNQYCHDLKPDFHYVPITIDDVIKKYYNLINDESERRRISENALVWFNQNIAYPANMELTKEILE